jgi:hypothetical protein
MLALLITLIGLAVTAFIGAVLWVVSDDYTEDPGAGFVGWGMAVFIDALIALYFLAQFIRWAWMTPISF